MPIATIRAAAKEAQRPEPRVGAGCPIVVTGDVQLAHEVCSQKIMLYKTLPSYRAMLDREGVEGVDDLVITGDEAAVASQLEQLRDAGVTDFCGFPFEADAGSRGRTERLLADLAT